MAIGKTSFIVHGFPGGLLSMLLSLFFDCDFFSGVYLCYMATPKDWLHAFRLRTLPLSLSGIIVGSLFACSLGFWKTGVFVFAMITTLLFQVLSNLANDLGDTLKGADNQDRVGPQRAVQSGAISVAQMKSAVTVFSLLSFVSAGILIWLGTKNLSKEFIWFYAALAIACVVAAITYTIGKRAYGYHGLGDLFVFIFFGCVSVIGVFPLMANGLAMTIIPAAVTVGALSTAVLNLNNMRDILNDAAVGKRTLVVNLGSQRAKTYHFFLLLLAMVSWVAFLVINRQYIGFISCLPFLLILKHLGFVAKNSEPRAFDPELKKVALSTFFIAVLYTVSVLIGKWL